MSQQIESVKMALQELGINASGEFFYNPDYDLLIAHETAPELTGAARGVMTDSGAVAVDTGIFTGRSPRDKYIVRDEQTRDTVWWADSGLGRNDNKPLSPDVWRSLKSLVAGQLSGKKLYVIDAWCGASPDTRLGVRFVTEVAWQAHFVKKHVYRAERRRAGQLYARLRGAQRRGLHQCQLAGAGDELRELRRL
ncbi:phosphoenolpyruvate carboxykinase [Klebsiella variicola]|nr:phosphoenolpyruvate carboxykinase [Klebsiella variicola]